jgi:hypothetical protein
VEADEDSRYNVSTLTELMNPIITEVEGTAEIVELKHENDEMDQKMVGNKIQITTFQHPPIKLRQYIHTKGIKPQNLLDYGYKKFVP